MKSTKKYTDKEKSSIFDKIIDPKDKDRSLKIFGISSAIVLVLLVLISLFFGNGGFSGDFGSIVNTYKE
jgi:hypothetical protein